VGWRHQVRERYTEQNKERVDADMGGGFVIRQPTLVKLSVDDVNDTVLVNLNTLALWLDVKVVGFLKPEKILFIFSSGFNMESLCVIECVLILMKFCLTDLY
jgi:hypothetical protein